MTANRDDDVGSSLDFVTLGMFILALHIDDIHPSPLSPPQNQTPHLNIPGGAGTYSALGARLLSPQSPRSIGWIVDTGVDFPPFLRNTLASWQTSCVFRSRPEGELTTRGWNGYGAGERRSFAYLTPKKRVEVGDLTAELLGAKVFHLICSAVRCRGIVDGLRERRGEVFGAGLPRAIVVWEPVPDLCVPGELEGTFAALRGVDVVSPNHEELGALFGFEHFGEREIDRGAVERQSEEMLRHGGEKLAVVVRCGKEGCFVAGERQRQWLPAFHQDANRVVDPTGGGNGFLGGLAVGLARCHGDVVEAARWGSVAASFCIEQVGVPELGSSSDDGRELWNGKSVVQRLDDFRKRTH